LSQGEHPSETIAASLCMYPCPAPHPISDVTWQGKRSHKAFAHIGVNIRIREII
jgi:hypothetical protein